MGRTEKFVHMCLDLPFQEGRDERHEDFLPELGRVAELRDGGNMQEAIDYGFSLQKMYPDFDLIPFMIAYIYYQQDFPREAKKTAIDAMRSCPRRYRLYSVAGLAEYALGNIPEALVWWSRSVVAQCQVVDYQESDPFLYLAHAADIVGANRPSQLLFSMVDAIEGHTSPRLGDATVASLEEIEKSWTRKPLIEVLKEITDRYLHAA